MNEDWVAFLSSLLQARARFLVVGAHAMAVHGVPRGTQDLDVWIEPTDENAATVWQAMAAFGAPLQDLRLEPADLTRPDTVIQLGLPPNRIDILTAITGVPDFELAWRSRRQLELRGLSLPVLGRAQLIANKRATGRLKDRADLEALGEPPDPA